MDKQSQRKTCDGAAVRVARTNASSAALMAALAAPVRNQAHARSAGPYGQCALAGAIA